MNKNGNLVSCLLLFWFINWPTPIPFDFFLNKKVEILRGAQGGEKGEKRAGGGRLFRPYSFFIKNFLFLIWEGNFIEALKKNNNLSILKMRDPESMDVFP